MAGEERIYRAIFSRNHNALSTWEGHSAVDRYCCLILVGRLEISWPGTRIAPLRLRFLSDETKAPEYRRTPKAPTFWSAPARRAVARRRRVLCRFAVWLSPSFCPNPPLIDNQRTEASRRISGVRPRTKKQGRGFIRVPVSWNYLAIEGLRFGADIDLRPVCCHSACRKDIRLVISRGVAGSVAGVSPRHVDRRNPYRDYSCGAIASALDPIMIVISTWTVSLATIVNGCGFARRCADSPLCTSKM